MLNSLVKNLKHILVTLRFSILTIFVTLFVSAILLLIIIDYVHSSKTLMITATKLMHEATQSIYQELTNELSKAERDNKYSANLIQQDIVNPDNPSELITFTVDLANEFNVTDADYWGDEKGNVVSSKFEDDGTLSTLIINRNSTQPSETMIYRDAEEKVIKKEVSHDLHYDPRIKPWYLEAKKAKKTIWTDVYLFHDTKNLGITVATPVYKPDGSLRGVFEVDFRLDWLSWYIDRLKISPNATIFVVTKEGALIAYPKLYEIQKPVNLRNIHSLQTQWVSKAFDLFNKNNKSDFNFSYQGNVYLASFKVLPQFERKGWFVGVVAPKDDFTSGLKQAGLIDVGIGLLILIAGVLIVSNLVTQVVEPIRKLVKQTDKIKRFDLEEEERVPSRIKEVVLLSNAVHSMRLGLKSFQKYVPADLVRQLIEAGENARIGGAKKQLTIFFSDIENFTALAETMDPNQLMECMGEYFDEVSKVLISEKATIDKYIGDSIMAFWGAPLDVDHPCVRAARAALKCMHRIDEINEKWRKIGKQPLITRIGMHTGEAIVGNVGSAERINYTAIGDTINVASRLEGVNKKYGTRIIVSDALYDMIKDHFVLKKVDVIAVRGRVLTGTIYELIAENKSELNYDIDAYTHSFDKGFEAYQNQWWDKAIKFFDECLQIHPDDSVALVFIKRCHHFKAQPPEHWDGVWRSTFL